MCVHSHTRRACCRRSRYWHEHSDSRRSKEKDMRAYAEKEHGERDEERSHCRKMLRIHNEMGEDGQDTDSNARTP